MSSGSYIQVHVGCPFYAFDDPKKKLIGCEAVTEKELPTKRQFKKREDLDWFMTEYCCKAYRYCEYYRMLVSFKYD